MSREVFFLAGETSGDARGAELIRALRAKDPTLHFSGMGGPLMRRTDMEVLADLSDLAVVGIIEVLKHYRTFKRTMDLLLREIHRRKPLAVLGVDYPGFNLRLLQRVRRSMPHNPIRLVQYVSPQLWAWNEKRKGSMAQYLDLVLCIFPFEPKIYENTGLQAIFVGHPLASASCTSPKERDLNLVAFLPGSREKEIRAHMPVLIESSRKLQSHNSQLRVAYAASSDRSRQLIQSFSPQAEIRSAAELLHHAAVGAVCSGTATLEATLAGLPITVFYRVAWPTYWMGRALIKVPHLAMPNILAGRPLVKEFLQSDFTPEALSSELSRLRLDLEYQQQILQGYQEIRSTLGDGRAAENAAQKILDLLGTSDP